MAELPTPQSDSSSAHPPGWPGIPGRSAEQERSPQGGTVPTSTPAKVTEAQRALEKEVKEATPPAPPAR